MLKKRKILEQIEMLPDEFSIDELVERLILLDKVERGIKDAEEGKIISHDEMLKRVNAWFK